MSTMIIFALRLSGADSRKKYHGGWRAPFQPPPRPHAIKTQPADLHRPPTTTSKPSWPPTSVHRHWRMPVVKEEEAEAMSMMSFLASTLFVMAIDSIMREFSPLCCVWSFVETIHPLTLRRIILVIFHGSYHFNLHSNI